MELYGGLVIRDSQPSWLSGAYRATVTIGSNHYSEDGETFTRAAANLRVKLAGLFAYAEACKHTSFAEAVNAEKLAMDAARTQELSLN